MPAPNPQVVQDNTRQTRTDSRVSTTSVTPLADDVTEVKEERIEVTRTTGSHKVETERETDQHKVESERITKPYKVETKRETDQHKVESERITKPYKVETERVTDQHFITTTNKEAKGYVMQFKVVFQARHPVPPIGEEPPDPCA